MYDKIKKVYEEGGNIEETLSGDAQNIPLPSLGGNTGDKSKSAGGNDDDNCQGITRIHRSPSRPRPSVRPTAALINIHEHPI